MKVPTDYIVTCIEFEKLFSIRFPKFEDKQLKGLWHVAIDICAFEDFIHAQFGNYEEQGKSMQDVIIENYGERANNLIMELL